MIDARRRFVAKAFSRGDGDSQWLSSHMKATPTSQAKMISPGEIRYSLMPGHPLAQRRAKALEADA